MAVPVILVCYGEYDFAGRSRLVSTCLHAPHPENSEQEFIDFLLRLRERFPGAVVFPALDDCLIAVSRHKALLERYFRVACTDWESHPAVSSTSRLTYALAERCGVPAPRTLTPLSPEEARSGAGRSACPVWSSHARDTFLLPGSAERWFRPKPSNRWKRPTKRPRCRAEVMLQETYPGR